MAAGYQNPFLIHTNLLKHLLGITTVPSSSCSPPPPDDPSSFPQIKNVWASNFHEEMSIIRRHIKTGYDFVSVDTEFPGIVLRPAERPHPQDLAPKDPEYLVQYQYETLRLNVNSMKLIQLGITLMNEWGHLPPGGTSTWQFNMKFNPEQDLHAPDSLKLLIGAGIDFSALAKKGIELAEFAEYWMSSGLVLNDNVTWITFHGTYDFAYIIKYLMDTKLPESKAEFTELLNVFFPNFYDTKYIWENIRELAYQSGFSAGLQGIATHLDIQRIGIQHQAGSDSLLTSQVFLWIARWCGENSIDHQTLGSKLYFVGAGSLLSSKKPDY